MVLLVAAPSGFAADLPADARTAPAPEAAPAGAAGAPPAHSPLIVGATSDNFVFSWADPNGQLDGFAVELFDALAKAMNLKIRRVVEPGLPLNDHFQHGQFDVLQLFTQSPERELYADFTVPFLTQQAAAFVRRNGPVHTLADLNGRKVAILGVGSIAQDYLPNRGIHAEIVYAHSAVEALRWVNDGEVAATMLSRLTTLSVLDRVKLTNVVELGTPIPLSDFEMRQCFAVHKGDAVLLARLNEGLAVLHRTGEYDRIYRKWFSRYEHGPIFTREQVISYVAAALAFGFIAAIWGLLRQRTLRKSIARQAGQLAEKEELLGALYDNVPTAMCVIEAGPQGHRLLTINRRAAGLFGLSREAAIGRRLDALQLAPEWSAHLDEALKRWPGGTEIVQEEHVLAASRRRVVITLVPLAPGANGLVRVCVLTDDITKRRQLDEELAQTRKLRAVGELVGGISHEFNNLLTPIMLKVGVLQLDRANDAPLQEDVAVIAEAAQHAAEITRRLLTFGRRSEARPESIAIEDIVTGSFALLRQTMDRRIVWEHAVPPNLPPLFFNKTDLHQILVNLLINARDTLEDKLNRPHPEGWTPQIRVEVTPLPVGAAEHPRAFPQRRLLGWQRLTVRDTGMGISPEARERIFEPFYTTKAVGRGTGLGLATIWHLTTEAGGRVDVDSTPGEGSAIHVLLPVWPAPKSAPAGELAAAASAPASARVFVVEDEELVARSVIAVLGRAGYRIDHYADGAKAWQHLGAQLTAYDLLVLDVNLPGMDGIELARRARAANFAGRILFVSGRLTPAQLQAIAGHPGDQMLGKPFDMQEFLAAVRRCLAPA